MGFFGTVFGLSHGLYQSFLATGTTNAKDFAKAIAIAFDNTLLGLALTIILFVALSLLRKREESVLLQLNLFAESWLLTHMKSPVAASSDVVMQIGQNLQQFEEKMAENRNDASRLLQSLTTSINAAHESLEQYGTAIKLVGKFVTTIVDKTKEATEISEGITHIGREITEVHSEVAAIRSSINRIDTNTGSISADVTKLSNGIGVVSTSIRDVNAGVVSISADISKVGSNVVSIDARIGKVNSSVDTVGTEIKTANAEITHHMEIVRKTLDGLPDAKELDQKITNLQAEIRRPRKIQVIESVETTGNS